MFYWVWMIRSSRSRLKHGKSDCKLFAKELISLIPSELPTFKEKGRRSFIAGLCETSDRRYVHSLGLWLNRGIGYLFL